MHCKRGCWRILQHKRTAWIAPALCAVVFLIYLSFVTEYEPGRTLAVQECMCGRCKPEKSSTEWFQQRFNAMIEPMLVGKDQVIPNHVQNWWLCDANSTYFCAKSADRTPEDPTLPPEAAERNIIK